MILHWQLSPTVLPYYVYVLGTSGVVLLLLNIRQILLHNRAKSIRGSTSNLPAPMKESTSAAIVKEPPLLQLTGPCARKIFHDTHKCYIKLILENDVASINQLTVRIVEDCRVPLDIKVTARCYQALCRVNVEGKLEEACDLFNATLESARQCVNRELLQGRVLRNYMQRYYVSRDNSVKHSLIICKLQKNFGLQNPLLTRQVYCSTALYWNSSVWPAMNRRVVQPC